MTGTKFEIERFDGDGDFSLWKRRMYAYLSVSGLKDVLAEKTSTSEVKEDGSGEEDHEAKKKKISHEESRLERCEKAMNMIFLNFGDHVLRKIERCTTAAETWSLLEALYLPKSLPNRVHAQLKLYGFKMQDQRSIDENVDDFLKIVGELSHLSIEVPEEVQEVLLLNALPTRYDQLKETLKYSHEAIKVEDVTSSAKSKEKEIKELVPAQKAIMFEGDQIQETGPVTEASHQGGRGPSQWIRRKSVGYVERKGISRRNATSG